MRPRLWLFTDVHSLFRRLAHMTAHLEEQRTGDIHPLTLACLLLMTQQDELSLNNLVRVETTGVNENAE